MSDTNKYETITTKAAWDDVLIDLAESAAKEKVRSMPRVYSKHGDLPKYIETIKNQYLAKLKKEYSFDRMQELKDQQAVRDWPAQDLIRFMAYEDWQEARLQYEPRHRKKQEEFAKFLPMLNTGKNSTHWMNMPVDNVRMEAAKLGYDVSTQEGFAEFLKTLGEYQNMYTRGQLLEEARKDPILAAASFVYPTAIEEGMKQIATGEGDANDVYKAGVLDGVVDLAMFGAPGLRGFAQPTNSVTRTYNTVTKLGNKVNPAVLVEQAGHPYIGSLLGATEQAALEGGRQYGKLGIDDELDPSLLAILGAGTAGATRPAIISAAQGGFNQLGGKTATDFARGVGAATRRGNPVTIEREAIQKAWPNYQAVVKDDKWYKKFTSEVADRSFDNPNSEVNNLAYIDLRNKEGVPMSYPAYGRYKKDYTDMQKYGRALGIGEDELKTMKLDDILDIYDNQMGNRMINVGEGMAPITEEAGAAYDRFASTLPAKSAELSGNGRAYNSGLVLGSVLGDVGSRVEPTFRLSPTDFKSEGTSGNIPDYKQSSWWRKLTPEQQAAYEQAMNDKKKQMTLFGVN